MKWTKDSIRSILERDDRAVLKGLLRIYSLQTATEQAIENTNQHNGVGFSGYDAPFLTSLAKGYIQYGRLTEKQMKHLRKKILRYAGQLARIANGEITCPPLPGIKYHKQYVTQPDKIITVPVPTMKEYEDEERKAIQEEPVESKKELRPLEW